MLGISKYPCAPFVPEYTPQAVHDAGPHLPFVPTYTPQTVPDARPHLPFLVLALPSI